MGLRARPGRSSASWWCTRRTGPRATSCPGPSPPSTTASSASCSGRNRDAEFETAKVNGPQRRGRPDRPRRRLRAARRRRARLAPDARLRRRLPAARRAALARARGPSARRRRGPRDLDRPPLRAGRLRLVVPRARTSCGSASAPSTRASTSRTRPCCWPRTSSAPPSATRATGSPTSCAAATEDGVFFVGDSAGHCLPLTAEGIRTALLLRDRARARAAGGRRRARRTARRRCAATPSSTTRHEWKFRWMLRAQRLLPRIPARVLRAVIRACGRKRFVDWSFDHYLRIAPPEFAGPAPRSVASARPCRPRRSQVSERPGRCPPAAGRPRPPGWRSAESARGRGSRSGRGSRRS